MKKAFTTLRNIWSIEELRTRIINTIVLLAVFRLGTYITLPGIDKEALDVINNGNRGGGGLLDLINVFAGGAFDRASIFALGIMPYISASIVMQLLTIAVPAFQKMQSEGEDGQQRMNQYTRALTILITAVQAVSYIINFRNTKGATLMADLSPTMFMLSSVFILVAGTMLAMWIGERITDRGLGNGISLLIMVGIISQLPLALIAEFGSKISPSGGGFVLFIVELVIWLVVILAVILLVQGTRRIPVNYAKRIVGNRQYGGARQYIPLKVNAAGVMPIIFAQALMFIPGSISGLFENTAAFSWFSSFGDYTSIGYNVLFFFMIVIFTYFYTAITIRPQKIADDLKKGGGFIPGVKPGKPTANFIDSIMSRITLPGAIFLGFVSIFPAFATVAGANSQFAQFFGGTSLLILVGVILDTLQQVESYLIMRHYDGLMKGGRIKGRTSTGGAITG